MKTSLSPRPSRSQRRHHRWWFACVVGGLVILLLALLMSGHDNSPPTPEASTGPVHLPGPPWRHGPAQARFTIVVYADLECPFCQSYIPYLREWSEAQSDITLQWHHLPLPDHEPAATEAARWAECVGEHTGHAGFWNAVIWFYQHTRGNGQGLPPDVEYPNQEQAVRACLQSDAPTTAIATQTEQAHHEEIHGTPSLRLIDHASHQTMTLSGPVQGDALLSALDLLASPPTAEEKTDAQ